MKIISEERREKIEKACLGIEELDDVMTLSDLLVGVTKNPIA